MPLPRIIAVDFDGCLVTDRYPFIGDPIKKNLDALKKEQASGSKIILWTSRCGVYLDAAVQWCYDYGIIFDTINEPIPEVTQFFGGDGRKIYASEYWDDKAVLMSEKPISEFSDGYHTFDELYDQRLILFVALVKVYSKFAWKSKKHENGLDCFGGGWFIVGITTPSGQYTYHYKNKYWNLFNCEERALAPIWDGHTGKDVSRLLTLPLVNPMDPESLYPYTAFKYSMFKPSDIQGYLHTSAYPIGIMHIPKKSWVRQLAHRFKRWLRW